MNWVIHESYFSPEPPYFLLPPPPPPPLQSDGFSLSNRVSPSILLIIIILAIIFFVSGLLHLLVRFLMRPPARDMDDIEGDVTALQGQLQQLFHLHDAGVDQSFIDTLPVFYYKAIIGLKNPFDCAVCLCEFEAEDKLRLLPKCSHAFHMECIDTWLLSHSTCPLCRANILPDFSPGNGCSPIVLVLESGSESSREIVTDRDTTLSSHLGLNVDISSGSTRVEFPRKSSEFTEKSDEIPSSIETVVSVKLGKFKNVDGGEGSSTVSVGTDAAAASNNNVDSRRCFSMGSFEYVMDESTSLQVSIRPPSVKKQSSKNKKPPLPLKPGHRIAMSECDPQSRRFHFNSIEPIKELQNRGEPNGNGRGIARTDKRESFSISKIWMRGKGDKPETSHDSSRRAFSFRFPVNRPAISGGEQKESSARRSCEVENGSEAGIDEENQSCYSMDSQASNLRAPSFTRRTLLWLMGRQNINKVGHASSSVDHV